MTDDTISIRTEEGQGGAFVAERGGQRIGELRIHRKPGTLTIVHTEVLPSGRGSGVGKRLVHAAVDFARAKHLKVLVVCPYAKTLFEREPELRDVLA